MLLDIERAEELTQMKIIDLFAGCGGLSLGFIQAGFSIEKAVEYDPVIANTYQRNHPGVDVIVDDIKNIDTSDMFVGTVADVWREQELDKASLMTRETTFLSIILM